jgi:hypothetical protein
MKAPFLIIRKYPYFEELSEIQLEITASNGMFSGNTDIYCSIEELAEIGTALKVFPVKVIYQYRY